MSEHDQREDYDDEPWKRRTDVAATVRTPAAIMSALGLVQLALSIVGWVASVALFVWNLIDPNYFDDDEAWLGILFGIVVSAICIVLNWLIVRAAARFRNFRNYRLVVAATVLFIFSVPLYYCVGVTLPVGVWALIVLFNPDVRARFKAVAKSKLNGSDNEASGGA